MSAPSADGKRRVCLVTAEFHGLFKNGGIGTANTGLALTLAEAGHDVTVAYVDAGLVDYEQRLAQAAEVIADWAARGVRIEFVPRNPLMRAGHEDHVAASFTVLQFLRGRGFDVVFFNECGGQGYHSLLAKKAGLFPDAPRMVVVTHGASAWVMELNAQLYWSLHPVSVDFLERRSVELADDLVCPSQYLVDWMREHGWPLPASTRVLQNALPPVVPAPPRAAEPINEIVFFGRLEARKGVDLFLDAWARLCQMRDMSAIKVTFLGKFSRIEGVHSGVHVLERTRRWPVPPTLITERDQEEALAYLSRPGVLAVMPSRAENSPCVVVECLLAGVPFIATDSGGTSELIAPGARAQTLSAPDPQSLALKIAQALDGANPVGALAIPQTEIRRAWSALVAEATPSPPPAREIPRDVALCLAFAEPPSEAAWRAALHQDFAEIVVVSPQPPPGADPRVRHIEARVENIAAARNLAASHARSTWLAFADERDVLLKPEALESWLTVARELRAEVVTGLGLDYAHDGPPREGWDGALALLPAGPNVTLAAFGNCLGEGCFLIDAERFAALGGFAADASHALRDRLLLTQALLAGARLEVAPAPLFWRRERTGAATRPPETPADQRRLLQAFAGVEAAHLLPVLESVASGEARRDRVLAALTGLNDAARELGTKLSFLPQRDSAEQNRPFLDYALLRGRYAEALSFAQALGDPELIALARAGAEAAAMRAVSEPAAPRRQSVSLLGIAGARVRPLAGVRPEDVRVETGAITHPLGRGSAILKAASLCPPGARRLTARAQSEGEFGLAVCDRFAQLSLDGDKLGGVGLIGWTGWRRDTLALDLPALAEPADVLLLARGGASVLWTALDVELALEGLATPSAVSLAPGATSLPHRVLAGAQLLTPAQDFGGVYFAPGSPILHHPLVGRPALVRLPGAVFAGAAGVGATFGIKHELSRPVAFAMWARRPGAIVRDVEGLADSVAFSGWRRVDAPFQTHRADIAFPDAPGEACDLYLATRVEDFPDNNYCHAVWHDIFIIESPSRGLD